jgi:hypothetical protein
MTRRFSRLHAAVFTSIFWWGPGSVGALAQKFEVGADFAVGQPEKEFRKNIDSRGYGLSGQFGYYLAGTPIMIGAVIGYLNYGTESRWEPFSNTIPDVTVEVRTTNNILMLHGFARVQPQRGPVRPYFEGLWGFNYLFTRTSIKDDDYYDDTVAATTNFDDFAGSWGVGTGVDIRLWEERQGKRVRGRVQVCLNVGARYLWGSEAEYLKKGSIFRYPDGSISYLVMRSRTDMLLPHVGVRVRF